MWSRQSQPPSIRVGARDSLLSRKQVEEVFRELDCPYQPVWMKTQGDLDKKRSLRTLDKTDFFTRELDEALLAGTIRVAVHSAKDLPDPLPKNLEMIALTQGVDPSDSLVLREGEKLRPQMVIATSSQRREEAASSLQENLRFVDIRGTINERLEKLFSGHVDGVVIAEAALIRLNLLHLNRLRLPGETVPGQGRLAVLARHNDEAMRTLFAPLHSVSAHAEYSLLRT